MMRAIVKRFTRRKNQSFSSTASQPQWVTRAVQSNSDACSAIEIVRYCIDRPADQPVTSHIILLQALKLPTVPEVLEAEPINSEGTIFEIPSAYRQEQPPAKRNGTRVVSLDKILFTIAFLYLVSVVAWLIDREKLQIPVAAAGNSTGATLAMPKPSTLTEATQKPELPSTQNNDYVPVRPPSQLPSLAEPVLDKSTLPRIPVSSTPPCEGGAAARGRPSSSGLAKPGEGATCADRPAAVKQQNYTPVALAAAVPPPPPPPPAAALPPSPLPVKKAVVPPPPSPAPKAASLPTLPPPAPQKAAVLPPPPPAPKAAAQPGSSPSAPVLNHRLVGVLDLGDRSAALFEVDGTTHRVQVGEAIATSGWQLQSIASQEAIIGRQGERRSVLAGQKF